MNFINNKKTLRIIRNPDFHILSHLFIMFLVSIRLNVNPAIRYIK